MFSGIGCDRIASESMDQTQTNPRLINRTRIKQGFDSVGDAEKGEFLICRDARVTYERVKEERTPVNPSPGGSPPCPVPAERAGAATPLASPAEGCVAC